ncbi:MAG: nitrilase-related carbon-nitrogen hydrolase [Bacteroidota bacterium]|nr:nitrilase-related carbon-nitrogen hydrolase [Bacteroidota bacterium]
MTSSRSDVPKFLFDAIHLYYHINIFFKRGNLGFPVFDTGFGKIGMMICFDWFFPEAMRTLALKGAQLIAHPSNLVLPHCPDAMVTRCLENKVFSATANRIGTEDRGGHKLSFIGKSEIVTPKGEILTRLSSNEAGISVVEINLADALNKRLNEYNDVFEDRDVSAYKL